MYQLVKISNGWLLKRSWIEESQPQEDTIFCGKDLRIAAAAMTMWEEDGMLTAIDLINKAARKEVNGGGKTGE